MSFADQVDREYQATRMSDEEHAEHEDRTFVLSVIEYLDRNHCDAVEYLDEAEQLLTREGRAIAEHRERALRDALALMRKLHAELRER
jgi:hypothetical protein